jgi:hypothetical protein
MSLSLYASYTRFYHYSNGGFTHTHTHIYIYLSISIKYNNYWQCLMICNLKNLVSAYKISYKIQYRNTQYCVIYVYRH